MLYPVLNFLRSYIKYYLDIPSPSGTTVELAPVPSREQLHSTGGTDKLLYISLLNIEEDKTIKPAYRYERRTPVGQPAYYDVINPEMRFYLYVMFTGNSNDYSTSLKNISSVITAFANKNVFEGADFDSAALWIPTDNGPVTADGSINYADVLKEITLDLHTQSLDQNNNMWQAMASNILPTVIYKVRLICIIPTDPIVHAGEVRDINISTLLSN